MKTKFALLLCALLLAAMFGGCGKSAAPQQSTTAPAPTTEAPEAAAPMTEPPAEPASPALAAYAAILEAAPALEGTPEQWQDLTFGPEEDKARFGDHYEAFALVDLNGDNVPELIACRTVNNRWTPICIFTYAGGEAILLQDPMEAQSDVTIQQCATAAGAYTAFLCEGGHIHSLWRGNTPVGEVEENTAYGLVGTELRIANCAAAEDETAIPLAEIAVPNTAENVAALLK